MAGTGIRSRNSVVGLLVSQIIENALGYLDVVVPDDKLRAEQFPPLHDGKGDQYENSRRHGVTAAKKQDNAQKKTPMLIPA